MWFRGLTIAANLLATTRRSGIPQNTTNRAADHPAHIINNACDASSVGAQKPRPANPAFNQRVLFSRRVRHTMSRSRPPSAMACERCINAPEHNPPANERVRLSERATWWSLNTPLRNFAIPRIFSLPCGCRGASAAPWRLSTLLDVRKHGSVAKHGYYPGCSLLIGRGEISYGEMWWSPFPEIFDCVI